MRQPPEEEPELDGGPTRPWFRRSVWVVALVLVLAILVAIWATP